MASPTPLWTTLVIDSSSKCTASGGTSHAGGEDTSACIAAA